ncbi:MAG: Rid family detoxifying hydrolase [Bifidobacteriaceae bacterium]|jgi:reactive intermediate/imine deaminase|nr:Rid family detoxifying hydrolase [Bifidobacteriaceae bacterium]MCI1979396.1 Rid family detoxifying hydrolase [Bifidobacteriaceae bacterium]
MAELRAVSTSNAPTALGAYSQAVAANGFVFVSGQLGLNPTTGELAGESAAEQAEQALKNIGAILKEAGSSVDSIVKVTIYLSDVADFSSVDSVYAKFIGPIKPSRVAFGSNVIPKPGALVEIDAIAAL